MSLIRNSVNSIKNIKQVDAANKTLGRKIFKNTNGLINNAAGQSKITKARLFSDYQATQNRKTRQLKSEGHVTLGKIADGETISTIRDRYTELIDSPIDLPDTRKNSRVECTPHRRGDRNRSELLSVLSKCETFGRLAEPPRA